MKKIPYLHLIFLLSLLLYYPAIWAQANQGYSTVYLIRTKNFPNGNGVLIDVFENSRGYNVFIDSAMVCTLNQYSFSTHFVPAGEHSFSARLNSKKFKASIVQFPLTIDSGKVYYIEVGPGHQKLNSPLQCTILSEYIGSRLILDLKQDKDCDAGNRKGE